jgi:hypothetical protein
METLVLTPKPHHLYQNYIFTLTENPVNKLLNYTVKKKTLKLHLYAYFYFKKEP